MTEGEEKWMRLLIAENWIACFGQALSVFDHTVYGNTKYKIFHIKHVPYSFLSLFFQKERK